MSTGSDAFASAEAERSTSKPAPSLPFHVVGIGASAGGLEPLESFFRATAREPGCAFVVVQHLSPDFESHMPQLLARCTELPIHVAIDGVAVEPNAIYLMPPRTEMVIAGGRLRLRERDASKSLSHPIDHFLRSLSADVGANAIAVILSGSGSDGSRGIVDVHSAGGLVIVQSLRSARFDGMPRNAIAAGVCDLVLAPEEMPQALSRYARKAGSERGDEPAVETSNSAYERVFAALQKDFQVDFAAYRRTTVDRRIERRMLMTGTETIEAYAEKLERDPVERGWLYRDLLIGVTRFFRDTEGFAALEERCLRDLLSTARGRPLRIWVAGCATGEEAYSLAILLHEAASRGQGAAQAKIFATDAHRGAIEFAANGVYSEHAVAELSPERRARYFREDRDGWHVVSAVRQMIVFARQDLLADPPFTQLDLISCRNLLIYLQPAAQHAVLSLFRFGLRPGGYLFLGPSESAGEVAGDFEEIDKRWRLLRKRDDAGSNGERAGPAIRSLELPRATRRPSASAAAAERALFADYEVLLQELAPQSFLVDGAFRLLHSFHGAERFLRVGGGRSSTLLGDLLPDPLGRAAAGALQQAASTAREVRIGGLAHDGGVVRLIVRPLRPTRSEDARYLVVVETADREARAADAPPQAELDAAGPTREHVASIEGELRIAREALQHTIEQLEAANEELQASNEELVASNEELQGTNEELHSVNEELYTVNGEYQRKIAELMQLTDDMDNLLASTSVGVVFLDRDLYIRRFTPEIARSFHLIPQDVGRRIDVFAHDLDHEGLLDDLARVLDSGAPIERETKSRDGRPYLLRISPYRSTSGAHGVVLTLVDVASLKQAQADLELFKFISEHAVDAQVLLDEGGGVEYANAAAERVLERPIDVLCDSDWESLTGMPFGQVLELAAASDRALVDLALESKERARRIVELSVTGVRFAGRRYSFVNVRDVTARREAEQRVRVEHGVSRVLAEARSVEEAYPRVMDEFLDGFQLYAAELWVPRGDRLELHVQRFAPAAARRETWSLASRAATLADGEGIAGSIARRRAPCSLAELAAQESPGRRDAIAELGLRSAFGVPVLIDERCAAVLVFLDARPSQGGDELVQCLASIRRSLEQFVRRGRSEIELRVRNRAIAEAREGVVITDARDPDVPIVFANAGFERLTGYAREEVLGRNCRFLQGVDTDRAAAAEIRDALHARRECRVTILNYHKSGKPFWNELHISPVHDDAGDVTHFVGIQHDVSQSIAAKEELRNARAAAESASEAKSVFLANISHEIRTPLSAILGFSDILLDRVKDPTVARDLRAIRRNGAYLVELVDDILDLSRIESGKLRLQRTTFALAELVLDLDSLMQVRSQERGLPLSFTFTTEVPQTIHTDRVRVRQILVNLIGNALKFTESGSVRIEVALARVDDQPALEFRVIDTGPGIAPSDLARIFEPFEQVRRTAVATTRSSAGLGLSISRRLAAQLGGTIEVESVVGQGSTFTLSIPTGPLEDAPLSRPDLHARAIGATQENRAEGACIGCRVLVVDDLEDVRRVAAYFLERAGAQVELACSGAEALAKIGGAGDPQASFDVVLMDMQMPELSGDQVVARLRAGGFLQPILALTASAMKEQSERWRRAGCDDVLPKPIDGLTLVRAVAGHRARWARERPRDGAGGRDPSNPPLRVLVVEDNLDAAESLRRLLELQGAWVEVAHSGQEALERFRERTPELVLADLRLTDIDGFALVQSMIAQRPTPKPLFVAVSGLSDPEDAARAASAGFDLQLVKPVDPQRLIALHGQARARRGQ